MNTDINLCKFPIKIAVHESEHVFEIDFQHNGQQCKRKTILWLKSIFFHLSQFYGIFENAILSTKPTDFKIFKHFRVNHTIRVNKSTDRKACTTPTATSHFRDNIF